MGAEPPRATYRLQFNANFTFDDAAAIAPYLSRLGVSHIYASPIQKARPGSAHGYDIVDHGQINPELGGWEGFCRFSDALSRNGLRLLLDIVPNHMGVGGADNAWWLSVLEWGEQSPYAHVFDIDWDRIGANRKLVLPFLGQPYGAALRAGELRLSFDEAEGSFSVWHWEHRFPVNPLDYRFILEWALVAGGGGLAVRPLYPIAAELHELAEAPRPVTQEGRIERCERIKRDLAAHAGASQRIREAVEHAVSFACGDPRTPESFGALHRILERQSYRLAFWRVASSETNYRRFFDINSLAGVRVEDDVVFEATHALVFRLVDEGLVHGLRIDHVDGLAEPENYLKRLRARLGPDFYIVVEKILEPDEGLPEWLIAGTTGYEAMAALDGVFISQGAEEYFTQLYEEAAGAQAEFQLQLRRTKLELLRASFGSELQTLASDVKRNADADLVTSDFTLDVLRRAISEVLAALPVYRTYISANVIGKTDRELITQAVANASATTALDTADAHDLIQALLLATADASRSPSRQVLIERIIRRFQQLTGPVMAKSLEDTLFYRYARFVALNEVGADPSRFGLAIGSFHAFNEARAARWPTALVPTATHDMKRGEDVRARLAALSHRPEVWRRIFSAADASAPDQPDANDRYMLLQTIVGAWPVATGDAQPVDPDDSLRMRFTDYAIKAVRESKRRSTWTAPDERYETALREWIAALLASGAFRRALAADLPEVAKAGMRVSLARLVLKLTIPGVPDIYQGREFEDLSLVDPDNRRPVDYPTCAATLHAGADGFSGLKQSVTATLLRDRKAAPSLYVAGDYRPIEGPPHLLRFSRSCGRDALIVALSLDPFAEIDEATLAKDVEVGGAWSNLLGGSALEQRKHGGHALPAVVLRKSY
ncbi:MAG: malto-oligosyltrehalose synthase [Beijerinckiaceae bacterium]